MFPMTAHVETVVCLQLKEWWLYQLLYSYNKVLILRIIGDSSMLLFLFDSENWKVD
jgi:hypothetical protein